MTPISGILDPMTNSPQQPPAGWYPDPAGSGGERFWDGSAWSQSTRDQAAPQSAPSAGSAPGYGTTQSYGSPAAGQQPYQQQAYQQRPEPQQQPYQQYGQQPQQYQPYGQPQHGQGYDGAYGSRVARPAGFWWRFLGYLIDGLLIGILTQALSSVLGFTATITRATDDWARELLIWTENQDPGAAFPLPGPEFTQATWSIAAVSLVLWILYRVAMYSWKSATLGQLATGLRLVKAEDPQAKLSMGTIVLRAVASSVFFAVTLLNLVNGLAAAFSSKKQTLADMVARTQVFKIR